VVTRQRYTGRYVIQNIVKGRPDVGPVYQLFNPKTGKTLKNLATHDRLKLCNVDRDKFSECLPRMVLEKKVPESKSEDALSDKKNAHVQQNLSHCAEKKVKEKTQYLVHYDDNVKYCCDWVSLLLLQNYAKQVQHWLG